jgi:hypothetical protein
MAVKPMLTQRLQQVLNQKAAEIAPKYNIKMTDGL